MANLGLSTKGTENAGANDIRYASHDTSDGTGGTTDLIHAIIKNNNAGVAYHIKVCIYSDAGSNSPGTQLAPEIEIDIPAAADGEVSGAYVVALSPSTKYWLAWTSDNGNVIMYYNLPEENKGAYDNADYTYDLLGTFNKAGNLYSQFSLWASYSAGGGSIVPMSRYYARLNS
jgi:hypothetical protein